MRTDHTADDESRIDSETDSAVDVALDVALELADDPEVARYIRRALQSRVRVRDEAKRDDDSDVVDVCPECCASNFYPQGGPGAYWCENCELEYVRFAGEWNRYDVNGAVDVDLEDGGNA